MNGSRLNQLGALGGVLFIIMSLTAQAMIQVGSVEPAFNASAAEIAAFFSSRNNQLSPIASYVNLLSTIPLLWFLGVLWSELQASETGPAWLSLVAFGSGLAAAGTIIFAPVGWDLAMLRVGEGLDPAIATLLFDQGNLGFANYQVALAGMMLAAGIVGVRDGALPRWLAWFGLVAAVLLLVGRWFWFEPSPHIFVPYLLFAVWLISTSVVLFRRVRKTQSTAALSTATGGAS